MTFDVGGADYEVERRHVLTRDGKLCDGYLKAHERLILIDGRIADAASVIAVLRHEHCHAWEFELGVCRLCPESRAQFNVVTARTFDRDWKTSGGITTFLALPVRGVLPMPTRRTVPSTQQLCRHCQFPMTEGRCASCE